MASGGREETAHVSGQDGRSRGNRVHLDSKDPRIFSSKGDVIPLRKAGNVFVIDLSGSEKTQPAGSRVFTGRPESRSLRNT